MNEVNTLANLQHPNLCKLLGFYASDSSEPRMLVYERLSNGSLDRLLFGKSAGPSIDWNTRIKIAICAAQALTFLHEEGPLQVINNIFVCGVWIALSDCHRDMSYYVFLNMDRTIIA
jgi:serine/threonine protein kinase